VEAGDQHPADARLAHDCRSAVARSHRIAAAPRVAGGKPQPFAVVWVLGRLVELQILR
jgi:hypothetical protein